MVEARFLCIVETRLFCVVEIAESLNVTLDDPISLYR